jgi:oligopeptide/dipeptide ABC transporter ATP-binding protein
MTTSDNALPTGGVPERSPEGTTEPTIRGRLRGRLPARIRTARGQLLALMGYLILVAIAVTIFVITGGAAKNKLPATEVAAATVGNLVVAAMAFLATRLLQRRSAIGYWLGLFVGVFTAGAGVWAIYRVISGAQNLPGDPGFFFVVYQSAYVVLGAAIAYNLLREIGSIGAIASEATHTGEDLHVELRDLRVGRSATTPAVTPTDVTSSAAVAAGANPPTGVVTPGEDRSMVASGPDGSAARADDDGVEPLLAVRGLKKHFPIVGGLLRRQIGTVYAVDGVDFDVYPGEIFSLVGESGCGKTTLGRTVLQLTPPTDGKVIFDGYELADVDPDDMRPLRRRMQIIFQDPFGSLNPRMPVLDIIGEGLLAQGITDRKIRDKRVEDSLEIVGLRRDYTRRYPHEFSGGQRQRIGIARALALGPDLVVCDEPVSALDVSIQSQVLNLLLDLRRDFNLTYLFISHNLSVVQYFSDRVGVMYLGKLAEEGAVEQLYRDPRHPYTVALLSAIPDPDPRRRKKRLVLKGDVPSPAAPPSGCRFHTRCWLREKLGNPERCVTEEPLLRPIGEGGHRTACHFAEEVSDTAVQSVVATQSAIETAVADPA